MCKAASGGYCGPQQDPWIDVAEKKFESRTPLYVRSLLPDSCGYHYVHVKLFSPPAGIKHLLCTRHSNKPIEIKAISTIYGVSSLVEEAQSSHESTSLLIEPIQLPRHRTSWVF